MKRAATSVGAMCVLTVCLWCMPSAAGDKPAPAVPVKFKLVQQLVFVDVKVNGKGPYTFFLDTGAGATIFSPELASALELKLEKRGDAVGATGGKSDLSIGRVASIAVGDTILKNFEIAVLDVEPIANGAGKRIDGIIGYTFLKDYRVTIDYPKETVLFEPSAK